MFDKKKKKNQAKKSEKHTTRATSSKRNTAPSSKSANKPATKNTVTGKQTKSAAPLNTAPKKKAAPKNPQAPKLKVIKHNEKFEQGTDDNKPIVINGANSKPKHAPKVLRKVAKAGGYTAWDDIKRNGKTFATEQEAKDYAADVLKKTGKIVPISPTDRHVTHSFTASEQTESK